MSVFVSRLKSLTRPARLLSASMICRYAVSFSASGEDHVAVGWLQTAFGIRDWSKVRYLDVGACYPMTLNNTFAFYRRGASGVLLEPNPHLARTLKKRRPRDRVVCAGAAFDNRRTATYTMHKNPVFNGFVEGNTGDVVDRLELPLVPLNDLFEEHLKDGCHFMSIDAEGVDFEILRSLDFRRFKPLVVCVEASQGPVAMLEVLKPHGYQFICKTPDNLMYALY
jgi:FkbM family methyltransferase